MELRELTARDRADILALFTDVFTNEPWYDDWSDAAQLNAYLDDLTGQPYSLTLGFLDGSRLMGLSMGHVKHWYAGTEYCIDEFCVARQMQGKGIGTAFMRAIEAYLAERQIPRIFLQTDRTAPAYAFYRRMGFKELDGLVSFSRQVEGPADP